jgi:daunorubicin/doxorubicin transport system permease protein
MLSGCTRCWLWNFPTCGVRSPESVTTTSFLQLFPLTFVRNIFVDPVTMPAWLQRVARVNPVSHLATALRALMNGCVAMGDVVWALVASVTVTLVFAPIAMRMYYRER